MNGQNALGRWRLALRDKSYYVRISATEIIPCLPVIILI